MRRNRVNASPRLIQLPRLRRTSRRTRERELVQRRQSTWQEGHSAPIRLRYELGGHAVQRRYNSRDRGRSPSAACANAVSCRCVRPGNPHDRSRVLNCSLLSRTRRAPSMLVAARESSSLLTALRTSHFGAQPRAEELQFEPDQHARVPAGVSNASSVAGNSSNIFGFGSSSSVASSTNSPTYEAAVNASTESRNLVCGFSRKQSCSRCRSLRLLRRNTISSR